MPPKQRNNQLVQFRTKQNKPKQVQSNNNKKRQNVIPRPLSNTQSSLAKLRYAYLDAFDPRAIGCTAPDDWPTSGVSQFHVRVRGTIAANSSGIINFSTYACPGATFTIQNGSFTTSLPYVTGTSALVQGIMTDQQLSDQVALFRPVAGALRIRNNLNFSTVAGNGIVATIPCAGTSAKYNQALLTAISATAVEAVKSFTIGDTATLSLVPGPPMISLPSAQSFSMDQLIDDEILIRFLPMGPGAYRWRNCSDEMSGGSSEVTQQSTYNTTTGLTTGYAINEACDCTDWSSGHIFIEGLPASSQAITYDYILHYEGRRNLNTGLYSYDSSAAQVPPPSSAIRGLVMNLPTIAKGAAIGFNSLMQSGGLLGGLVRTSRALL